MTLQVSTARAAVASASSLATAGLFVCELIHKF